MSEFFDYLHSSDHALGGPTGSTDHGTQHTSFDGDGSGSAEGPEIGSLALHLPESISFPTTWSHEPWHVASAMTDGLHPATSELPSLHDSLSGSLHDSLSESPHSGLHLTDLHQIADPNPASGIGASAAHFIPGSLDFQAGDAASAEQYWHYQGPENSCAVVAQGSIIESITGVPFDQHAAESYLGSHGWFDPDRGTPQADMTKLFDHYGIRHEDGPQTTRGLQEALSRGDKVMVALDPQDIWPPAHDASGQPIDQPGNEGHAVWVTEIGHDPTDGQWKVVINDSAREDGDATVVSLADFEKATADFNHYSVIVDPRAQPGVPTPAGSLS